jgi:hypothetical protein
MSAASPVSSTDSLKEISQKVPSSPSSAGATFFSSSSLSSSRTVLSDFERLKKAVAEVGEDFENDNIKTAAEKYEIEQELLSNYVHAHAEFNDGQDDGSDPDIQKLADKWEINAEVFKRLIKIDEDISKAISKIPSMSFLVETSPVSPSQEEHLDILLKPFKIAIEEAGDHPSDAQIAQLAAQYSLVKDKLQGYIKALAELRKVSEKEFDHAVAIIAPRYSLFPKALDRLYKMINF